MVIIMEVKSINIYNELNKIFEESFRRLRENIRFCSSNKEIKVIAITSNNQKEGKTTIAINFAISLATLDYKVLFMDADLRNSVAGKPLMQGHTKGITDYIEKDYLIEEIICNTSIKNLSYISSGSSANTHAESISSIRFKELLLELREKYDYVIIDTPPIGSVVDGIVIASISDGTVLVVETGKMNIKVADRVVTQFSNANANVLGVVLNKMNRRDFKKYYCDFKYYKQKS